MERIITLTTDFGTKDGYAGSMKGVILKINPHCRIIDITHEIFPQDVLGASMVVKSFYRFFPEGSIHVVVVDPEVGSKRKSILVKFQGYFFFGPDNGVFSHIYRENGEREIIELNQGQYFFPGNSATFHGRDIFAPAAAHLSSGVSPREMGKEIKNPITISLPEPEVKEGVIVGEVIYLDRFGNLVTNISRDFWGGLRKKKPLEILIGKKEISRIVDYYAQGKRGEVLALFGSFGLLEIAVRDGSAHAILGVDRGEKVRVREPA